MKPSSLRHCLCASMRYLHFSSSCSGMHASRAFLVIGHAQQIFLGLASATLLEEAPMLAADYFSPTSPSMRISSLYTERRMRVRGGRVCVPTACASRCGPRR